MRTIPRAVAWLLVLAACGGSPTDAAPPSPPAPTCRSAGEHLIDLVVAGKDPPPPDEAVNQLIALVDKRCRADAWSAAAIACFSRIKGPEDVDPCASQLTEAQANALQADVRPPAEQGAREKKSEDKSSGDAPAPGTAADPCDGGE